MGWAIFSQEMFSSDEEKCKRDALILFFVLSLFLNLPVLIIVMEYDVVGFGHSLLDITLNVDDAFLEKHGIIKGVCVAIDDEKTIQINEVIKDFDVLKSAGGSISNIIAGVALLGGKTAFIGGLGDDQNGKDYMGETLKVGVKDLFIRKKGVCTGVCMTFITPDGERSFLVNYGNGNIIKQQEIKFDFKTKVILVEGFTLENNITFKTDVKLCEYAKLIGAKVALDVNDVGIIKRNSERIKKFIQDYVDILFMNEHEAEALCGHQDELALNKLEKDCDLLVLKLGENGSMIRLNGSTVKVLPKKVDVINTNGAGDAYAAAFLFGLVNEMNVENIGVLASNFAANVVMQPQARLSDVPKDIKKLAFTK